MYYSSLLSTIAIHARINGPDNNNPSHGRPTYIIVTTKAVNPIYTFSILFKITSRFVMSAKPKLQAGANAVRANTFMSEGLTGLLLL